MAPWLSRNSTDLASASRDMMYRVDLGTHTAYMADPRNKRPMSRAWTIKPKRHQKKCRHLKKFSCKETLWHVFIRVYRLEIKSVMFVRPPTGLFYIERDPHSRTEIGERDVVLSAQE